IVPTSLPDGIPLGIVATIPSVPRVASKSMLGLCAAASGVLPPSSSHAQSAIPSPCMMTYFIVLLLALEDFQHFRDVRFDHDCITQVFQRRVRILQAVAGERAHDDRARLEQ